MLEHEANMFHADDINSDGNNESELHGYGLRPQPRGRTDLNGFNSALWMGLGWVLLVLALLFPFPWWW
jgi:hypothetical protein